MGILTFLYTLIISPLELLFENIFVIANRIIGNEGLSIIFLSLAVNFLVLPLYRRADELQTEEREIQIKMAPMIKHIKSTFKGDERFFMLQEYYRTNQYKPVYALKSSISIILQIPFFIAAYNLLSGMQSLQGMSFGFIPDLGREDAVLMIGSFPLNLLPVLMTLINVVSGIIYTKGHPVKEKIQVFGLAAVFLVLLYRSPSGLVFYWLMNNVFSLIKNVFSKLKDPKKTFNILIAAAGLVILVISLIRPDLSLRQKLLLAVAGIMPVIPLAAGYLKNKTVKMQHNERAAGKHTFIYGAFFMAVFSGVFIPANVINSSPGEFIDMFTYKNPILYVVNSFVLAVKDVHLPSPKSTFQGSPITVQVTFRSRFKVRVAPFGIPHFLKENRSLRLLVFPLILRRGPIRIGLSTIETGSATGSSLDLIMIEQTPFCLFILLTTSRYGANAVVSRRLADTSPGNRFSRRTRVSSSQEAAVVHPIASLNNSRTKVRSRTMGDS